MILFLTWHDGDDGFSYSMTLKTRETYAKPISPPSSESSTADSDISSWAKVSISCSVASIPFEDMSLLFLSSAVVQVGQHSTACIFKAETYSLLQQIGSLALRNLARPNLLQSQTVVLGYSLKVCILSQRQHHP